MDATTDPTAFFFTQGILGVLVVVLAGVCYKLYTKIQQLNDDRLTDAKDVTKEVVTALQANTASTNVLTAKIEAGKREAVS